MNQRILQRFKNGLFSSAVFLLLGRALLFLMWIVLARLLDTDAYGRIHYIYNILFILAITVSFGLPLGTVRFVAQYETKEQWGLLKGFLVGIFVLLLSAGAVVTVGTFILLPHIPLNEKFRDIFSHVALLLVPMMCSFWLSQALRGYHRFIESILPTEVFFPIGVIGLVLLLDIDRLTDVVFVFLFIFVLVALIAARWLWQRIPEEVRQARAEYQTRHWIATSVPMVLGRLMRRGVHRWGLLMLGAVVGMEATGVYSAALQASLLASLTLRIISTVVSPMIASAYYGGRRHELYEVIQKGTLLSAIAGIPVFLLIMIWPELLLMLFGERYLEATTALRILAVGQLVNTLTGPVGIALMMTGHERVHAKLMIVTTLLILVGNVWAIPIWGSIGAASVTSVGLVLGNLSFLWAVRRTVLYNGSGKNQKASFSHNGVRVVSGNTQGGGQ